MMGYEIGDGDANGRHNWSMKHYSRTLERDCFYFMVPISSVFINFVKP